ncbi:MAG TPA: Fe-S cluster assembly protein SufB [Nanoarchaeota archaeon]|nr:Fe-S cluster assembly protein SufB [Candidatus Woesearchaeota archaeon]HIH15496.1 Fe-S cluster assembly protein SufB [Nanoarchaeota archaeon]HIH59299.1 Fe-S cluster assembly protein SufB [Nanoarchaeota archaeon]HII13906.1 Fe-S cluster assembly protein SufB [Nanoarchaeota archaeon]HIJ04664.1 Fe-S cluster assembly protein SufB [Nanoarchaeota archaeon]
MKKEISVSRALYDDADEHTSRFIAKPGINEEIVRLISKTKNEPEWMLEKRLKGLKLFGETRTPTWGPDLSSLDFNNIIYFADPNATATKMWEDVPPEIRKTFDRLGIPEAEKTALAGVGAQYDSSIVYHNIQKSLEEKGVIFENMDVAVQKYPDLVKKYFMTNCIPIHDHKFIMLHAAVWSGGTFIYVPKNVKVDLPLQAYFRMNAQKGGQFEHTLIIVDEGAELHYIEGCSSPIYSENSLHAGCVELHVMKGARMRYSSIENWSKNVFNLNTKRAMVHEHAIVEWINGNMGSQRTMLYPCSVLVGEGARSESLGIAFAGPGQDQDTGAKAIHAAPNTSSIIKAKSISKGGGISTYRGLVHVTENATNTKSTVKCDALIIDNESISKTYPFMKINNNESEVTHEATVGKIGEEEIFYLMSRGIDEEQAVQMIVNGFIEPIVKALPLEYAVELNKLIELEMEGT